jgi:CheY-like chemotaxis protein
LIITDQTMPRLTGLELAREVAAAAPGLPVFLYTGYSEGVSEDLARAAGIRAFLKKPLDTANLRAAIREALG